jgi:hypothetical protein
MIQKYRVGLTGFTLLTIGLFVGGCSAENFKRAGYEAAKQHQCNEQILVPDCRDNYPSYEDYQREKSKIPE